MPPSQAGGGPDKRTTAYENIFGRPTAKPKGPVPPPGAMLPMGAPGGVPAVLPPQAGAAVHNWVHTQAHGGLPPAHAQFHSHPSQLQGQRWNGAAPPPQGAYPLRNAPSPAPPPHMYQQQPQLAQQQHLGQLGAYAEPTDRRASRTPSVAGSSGGHDPRMSFYGPPPPVGASADVYAAGYATGPPSNGYAPSPAPSYRALPPQQAAAYPDVSGYRHPPGATAAALYGGGSGQPLPRPPAVESPPVDMSRLSLDPISPQEPPQLPSMELGSLKTDSDDEHWFTPATKPSAMAAAASAPAIVAYDADDGRATPTSPLKTALPPSASQQTIGTIRNGGGAHTSMAGNGEREDGLTDYQAYQQRLGAQGATSAASSVYGGADGVRRRGSFESDAPSVAPSVAASMYTLPGQTSTSRFYGAAAGSSAGTGYSAGGAGGYFASHGVTPLTSSGFNPYAAAPGQPRMRTTSSATAAAQAAYAPSYADANPEWRQSVDSTRIVTPSTAGMPPGRFEARSMSAGQSSRPGMPVALSSPHGSVGSALPQQPSSRRGPLVYPALLSRVAEAFKTRVTLSERTKDGLSYTDCFDGREAVDRIAYIIKTTDRNLALLLGRALDAQKFFHDVTYDHRLRDSPNELYQFRVRLTSPFGSETEVYEEPRGPDGGPQLPNPMSSAGSSATPTRDNSTTSLALPPPSTGTTPATSVIAPSQARSVGAAEDLDDENALPTGVFTLLTDCYSPTCTRDRLCYSIACPRRLEQQARLNMKPQPILKRSISKESLGDVKEQGALWADSVSKEILESVSEQERKRQELINEVIYTERDFVRDLEYLRDAWIKPLRSRDIIPEDKRDDFVTQVFWNVLEIHAVNAKLAELLSKRQKQQPIVERIGDFLLEFVPHFQPFVKYGAHQLYGKYEFEKEKANNPAFEKFVNETERLPESRKLELNGYLTKPTTRLARYPLLLESVIKVTPDDNPDKQALPKVIKIVREFLTKVNAESGKSENRFNLAQLDQQLVFKQGEAVDLRLRDEQRELVFKGPLKRRGGTQSESGDLQVFLFDHALLMVKAKTVHKHELYKVFRKPIPLELLIVTVYDEVPTGKGTATRPKSVMSRTSTGNRLSGGVSSGAVPKQDQKTGYALTFTYLGRKGYTQTLWASTFVSRRKWFEHIETRQEILRQRSNIFDTITLSEGFFVGPSKVNCSVPFDFGRRIIYGTDDGVYLSDLREKARPPTKVLPLPGVTQVDVLEEYQILIILAERSVHTFTLDALDPSDPMGSLKRGRRISSHTSFFKAGQCLGRTLVCVVKSSSLSSTIKTLEPIEQNVRGKKQPTFRKLLQGGQETLRVFKEFYIPTESSSIHFLKSKLCVGCTKGFEIVDLETLDTQGLLDPADSNLDFVQRKENVKPIAIYRIDGEFLLCYDEFAFYVNKNGWRAKGNWIIHWEGNPTSFALHHPYVLAFEPSFVEVRHVVTGALHQVITGYNLRCLFADVPPPTSSSGSVSSSASSSQISLHGGAGMSPYGRPQQFGGPPPPPQGFAPQSLSRAQSYIAMQQAGGPPPPGFARSAPGGVRPPPPGPYGQQQMMYPGAPPPRPGVPYAFNAAAQAPRPPPAPQRNPVWESVAASRGQIVFIGDTSVFAIRPANLSTGSSSISAPG